MKHESYWNTSESLSLDYDEHVPEDFVWSTSEQSKLRTLSLFLIR